MNYLNIKFTLNVNTVSNAILITCGVICHPFWCFGTGFGLYVLQSYNLYSWRLHLINV